MKTSEQINEITAALAKAQGEITNPSKDSQNPHFRNFYADLTSGINAIRGALTKHGLAYLQATRLDGDIFMVDTRISHASGQWIESEYPACKFPAKPQEVGSALTYARRYSLFAIVGIAGEDDDGEAANKTETPARKAQTVKPVADQPWDEETSSTTRDVMLEAIELAGSEIELADWWKQHLASINKLLAADRAVVIEAKDDKKEILKGRARETARN